MITIRDAVESDVMAIRNIFLAIYGNDYAYPDFYQPTMLKKMIFGDDVLILVAEDQDTRQVVGTGSVVMHIGANNDLVGEFGRLAVLPEARGMGCGHQIMENRIMRVRDHLHLGLVENRAAHPYSQQISDSHGFVPLGFVPHQLCLAEREHIVLYGQYFGDSLSLRKNHPRIIPEAATLADLAMTNCGLRPDAIIDVDSAAYPYIQGFRLESLSHDSYSSLLRIERGRVEHREVFGPMRLHYGLFKLKARHSDYLVATKSGRVVGAIGYLFDDTEKNVRIIELVSVDDSCIHFMVKHLIKHCSKSLNAEFIEVDVSAFAPRMQRTFYELGFIPVAYIPALTFHRVERIDAIRMAKIFVPFRDEKIILHDASRNVAQEVIQQFRVRELNPHLVEMAPNIMLFKHLNDEQVRKLAVICHQCEFHSEDEIIQQGKQDSSIYLILTGSARTMHQGNTVGYMTPGECVGEMCLLENVEHSCTVVAETDIQAIQIRRDEFQHLTRKRPDIATVVYRNIATGLGVKLNRASSQLVHGPGTDHY